MGEANINAGRREGIMAAGHACLVCAHFFQQQDDQGQCRALPPTLTLLVVPVQTLDRGVVPQIQNMSGWPIVKHDQWCGSFTDRPRLLGALS